MKSLFTAAFQPIFKPAAYLPSPPDTYGAPRSTRLYR